MVVIGESNLVIKPASQPYFRAITTIFFCFGVMLKQSTLIQRYFQKKNGSSVSKLIEKLNTYDA